MGANSKAIALGMGVVCTGIVGFVGVYLPFYSQAAVSGSDARRELHKDGPPGGIGGGLGLGETTKAPEAPGGMWKNIEKAERRKEEIEQKARE
mmetsp:Transcript_6235/g.11084  ORF Transcript_6235/g.11084 Transcript_6235/m.11084 type:complete len:93 (-) Transcript_6235:86-364(-)|eukprot:CAMPEP_0184529800 /NCGR_PEP_ID=MMETSP0198_2-20121128/12592_1 /TAXON_ID=1112570 /ORGANISM="Thraustochytrium sp., Strain LLF1b" /LENGTH=92 /DNA_ID=CAMNT_0026921885 /DNA_START=70 /DNA_END=348 /DNA_ORIENTATION=-